MSVPHGYCHCGCGEKVPLAAYTSRSIGWVKGEPRARFIHGHNGTSSYVVDENGCWLWQGCLNVRGYGQLGKGSRAAHRVFYERHVGPIPEGLTIDHLCRVRHCVNPAHMEPVTVAENVRRGSAAKLKPEQVRSIKSRSGERGADLAREFGVSQALICDIRKGRAWADVEMEATR